MHHSPQSSSAVPAGTPVPFTRTGTGRAPIVCRLGAAVLSGLLLSAAFPPLEWSWVAWVALVPLLLCPFPRHWGERLLVGYLLGYAHFATAIHWLNEVGFGAGYLLAIYCALFPMAWYALVSAALWQWRPADSLDRSLAAPTPAWLCLLLLFGTATWIALEWVRAWLLTGFPWDQLGISQFQNGFLLASAPWTGVYGISALLILSNLCLAALLRGFWPSEIAPRLRPVQRLLPLLPLALAILPFWAATHCDWTPGDAKTDLSVLAVQGNLPQCRFWTEEELKFSIDTYTSLTRQGLAEHADVELVLWPECAIPATLQNPDLANALQSLQADSGRPLLLGALMEMPPDAQGRPGPFFNSAVLLNARREILDCYHKNHLVPFGEFVPGSRYFPWLVELIGMGRDLTSGRAPNLLLLPNGLRTGVNICFEDAFPEISREFTRRGADLLMTITNDSWYNESCGARQHLSHVFFLSA